MIGNPYKRKYHFELLAIGESMFVEGKYSTIYHAAYNWGVRYGIHLLCEKTPAGAKITRTEAPQHQRKPRTKLTMSERLVRIEKGIAFISLELHKIKQALLIIAEKQE